MENVEVKCKSCENVVEPEDVEGKRKYGAIGALVLGGLGGAFGSVVGIATAGVGLVATPFTLALGLYFGWKGGAKVAEMRSGVTCPMCGNDFSRSAEQLEQASAAASKARESASGAAESARDAVSDRRDESRESG